MALILVGSTLGLAACGGRLQPGVQTLDFKGVGVGRHSSKTFEVGYCCGSGGARAYVRITGDSASDFTVNSSDGCSNMRDGGPRCSVTITFTPSSPGLKVATAAVSGDLGVQGQSVSLSGVGGYAKIDVQPSTVNFGIRNGGDVSVYMGQAVDVYNRDVVPFTIDSASLDSNQYVSIAFDNCSHVTLLSLGNCGIGLVYPKTAPYGPFSAMLTVHSDISPGYVTHVPIVGCSNPPDGVNLCSGFNQ